jgi:hypothetical protein
MNGPRDISSRESWLDQRIRTAMNDGSLGRRDARQALATLDDIRHAEAGMRHRRGQLSARDEADIQSRLDALSSRIGSQRHDGQHNY